MSSCYTGSTNTYNPAVKINKMSSTDEEEHTTCRICFEPCTEELTCNCNGYVHRECQEKWINISGRYDCEVCNTPFEDEVVYEWNCSLGDQRCNCGSQQNCAIMMIILFALNSVYGILLLVVPEWSYIVGLSWLLVPFIMVVFCFEPIGAWNAALLWKWTSFLSLTIVYSVQSTIPLRFTVEQFDWRRQLIEIDALTLCAIFIFRITCLSLHGMRVRRLTIPPDTSDTTRVT